MWLGWITIWRLSLSSPYDGLATVVQPNTDLPVTNHHAHIFNQVADSIFLCYCFIILENIISLHK